MENKNKNFSLEEMTKQSLLSRPKDSIEAIGEYIIQHYESTNGEIDFSSFSKEDINKLLSYNIEIDTQLDIDIDVSSINQDFWTYPDNYQEYLLSILFNTQIHNLIKISNEDEFETEYKKLLVKLDDFSYSLLKKIVNPKFKNLFKIAITQTSLIVFLAVIKATNGENSNEVDFSKLTREFLFFSKDDDELIYNMKLFYLSEVDAESLGLGYQITEETTDEEAEILTKQSIVIKKQYTELIDALLKKYKEAKLFLN